MPRYFEKDDPKRWEKDEGNPVARAIMKRAWFLVIPLVGIWWFHTRSVVPQVEAVEATMKAERATAEEIRNRTLKEARERGVETSRLRAEADTFSVRSGQIATLLDSIIVVQNEHLQETRKLEAQSDSLRRVLSSAEGRSLEYSESLTDLQRKVDSLRVLIDTHQEETQRLEGEIRINQDLADRLNRPQVYRKNSALVTGEGDYPNRDALPKR